MNDQVLAALARFGEPALFAIVTIAAFGVPLPVTLLLIVTGSLASQKVMDLATAITVSSVASVLGDQMGYAVGRWGGKALHARLVKLLGSVERLQRLDEEAKEWGGASVFFSRWLLTPLGPWVNLGSGVTEYSWFRFSLWVVTGETFGCSLFILLGYTFSDRVQALGALLGDLTWAIVAILAAAFLGWKLIFGRHNGKRPRPFPDPTETARDPPRHP